MGLPTSSRCYLWNQDGGAENDVNQDLGRVFRPPLRWRWKMAALPLPVAILDDLISCFREWGHPRWRQEMRSSKMATGSGRAAIFHLHLNGLEKLSLYYFWCNYTISLKIPFSTGRWTFPFWNVYFWIWNRCTVGFVNDAITSFQVPFSTTLCVKL